ncbi:MAG: inverse autotransporter beta domain-containing protein [Legionellales bacterium]|nr:inverse autotransporter beta domain-containing protein [Legionellales bacterium]
MKKFLNLIYIICFILYVPVVLAATPAKNNNLSNLVNSEQRSVLLANPIKKPVLTPYSARAESRVMYGNERSFVRPMFLLPLIQSADKITFANVIAMADTKKNFEGNFGFGARWLKKRFILGGFIHYDYRRTKNNNNLQQVTVGLEYFQKYIEYRVNIYLPISSDKVFVSEQKVVGGKYNSTNNVTTYELYKDKLYEVTRKGLDVEVGGQLPQHTPFAAFARIFYFHHSKYEKVYGAQIRCSYQVREWLELRASYTADSIKNKDNHYFAGLNFIWQFKKDQYKEVLSPLSRKMVQMPIRDLDIVTTEETDNRQDLDTLDKKGLGVILPGGGGTKIDPNSNIAFNTVGEANDALKSKGVTVSHIATNVLASDKIVVTAKEGGQNVMSRELMEQIEVGKFDYDLLSNEPDTFGEHVINNYDDQRPSVVELRAQKDRETKEEEAKNKRIADLNAQIEDAKKLFNEQDLKNANLDQELLNKQQELLNKQNQLDALNQKVNDANDELLNAQNQKNIVEGQKDLLQQQADNLAAAAPGNQYLVDNRVALLRLLNAMNGNPGGGDPDLAWSRAAFGALGPIIPVAPP